MPLISVVIPYFNNASTIVRALRSVFSQTEQDFEILLVNDASPDWDSAKKSLTLFNDERLKILFHTINSNGACARNTGIKAAQGKYIAFLDADDEWTPTHLQSCIAKFLNTKVDLVYAQSQVLSDINYLLPTLIIKSDERIADYLFTKKQAIFTSTIVVRSEVATKILFNEALIRHQDYDFLLRFEASGYKAVLSEHIGEIKHWEGNSPVTKGETWDYSLKWAIDYKSYLTKRAFSNFITQYVVKKLLINYKFLKALQVWLIYVNPFRVTAKNYFLLAYPVLKPFIDYYKKTRSTI